MDNPFNTPAAPETTNTTTTKENSMTDTTTAKITSTYKGGSGFDAPWIVIHSDTLEDALEQAKNPVLKELMEATQAGGKHFAGLGNSAPANGNARSGQPQGSQTPPAGAPDCPPGWSYKEGVSKAGKAYKGFFPPRGDESKPIFFN